jgi:excisionase family DNA binding protein
MTRENPMQPIYITIPEAIKVYGISRTRIYEELLTGRLSAKKAGKRTLLATSDLDAYFAGLPAWKPKG